MDGNHHSTTRLVAKLLRTEKKEIGVILAYGIAVGLLSLAIPIGVQALVNTVTFGSLSQPLVFLILAVFAGLSLAAVFRAIQVLVVERLQIRFFAQIALELAARLPRVRMDRISGTKFPELVNRFFDVLVVQKSIATLLLEGFALMLQTLIGLVLLAFYHPALLAFDLVLVIAMVSVLFGFGRRAVKTAIEESVQKYRVAAWLEEVAGNSASFRNADTRRFALKRADELVVSYLSARKDHFRILFRQVAGALSLQALASALLLGLGAYLVIREQLTLGQLIAAEIVVTNVLNSLAKFQKHLEAFYDLAAGLDKIESLLSLPLEEDEKAEKLTGSGPLNLAFRECAYRYSISNFSLRPLSLEIPAGKRIAILGANGTGKSTLVDLIYGMRTPTDGAILLDGVDSRELGPEEMRRHIALVRGIEIIGGTVLENVAFGRDWVLSTHVKEALLKVGLLDEVLRLPQGIHTVLAENGSPLSVANAQALMLARAIAGQPRLLIVDESLEPLDADSSQITLKGLFAKDAPWTLLLCTHDPALAERCDSTITLENGTKGKVA